MCGDKIFYLLHSKDENKSVGSISWPEVIKLFIRLNSDEHEISNAHKSYNPEKLKRFLPSKSQILYLSC